MTLFLIGFFLILFCLYIAAEQLNLNNKLMFDEYKFKYFSLRDNLALLVVSGKLKESSWEYKHIVDAVNYHIQTVETISVTKIVSMLVSYHTSKKDDAIVEKLEKSIHDPAVISIVISYFECTRSLLKRNSRTQIALIHSALFIASLVSNIISFFSSNGASVEQQQKPVVITRVAMHPVASPFTGIRKALESINSGIGSLNHSSGNTSFAC